MAKNKATKRLVAKNVPTYLAKYFPGGKFIPKHGEETKNEVEHLE